MKPSPRPPFTPVVPAYAGVIHSVRLVCIPEIRRPRLRGGHPDIASSIMGGAKSSPPTRGSSWCATTSTAVDGVVPAYAGVIPWKRRSASPAARRPRLRGGHPGRRPLPHRRSRSSPPTRGSSRYSLVVLSGVDVVPAYAGVILRSEVVSAWTRRRPRLRGGHPQLGIPRSQQGASSPPTRGSSWIGGGVRGRAEVVPAYAGVIRQLLRGRGGDAGRPRLRGGHPTSRVDLNPVEESSPPTRGSSRHFREGHELPPVVPAYAGVILSSRPCSRC